LISDLKNKKILVVGLKRSGVALSKFLAARQASVVVTDMADEKKLAPFISEIKDLGVTFELGVHRNETFETADLIILSPGVPHTIEPVRRAVVNNVPVVGEMEFAYGFIEEPIVAITGTNGKTTATELLGAMLRHSGKKTFVGGNIGNPLIEYIDQTEKADVVVVEVSSFQLDTIVDFRPRVGILLNITDDHLDRYDGFDAYAASKARLFLNQKSGDTAVLNAKDPVVRPLVKGIKSRVLNFDGDSNERSGTIILKKEILIRIEGKEEASIDCSDIDLPGRHNLENIAAASLGAMAAGGTIEGVRSALKHFRGLPHRLEFVCERNGVRFYDDSKATNVDAVRKAIETFDAPIVIIMGGRDKGGDFQSLQDGLSRHAKKLIVMGEASKIISTALKGIIPTETAADMEEAVFLGYQAANTGDVVLLSPGCASFDMYDGYAMRGEAFKSVAQKIKA
jgi:UDP-N-acetylmuramoylalanine--D-glutamate ligase